MIDSWYGKVFLANDDERITVAVGFYFPIPLEVAKNNPMTRLIYQTLAQPSTPSQRDLRCRCGLLLRKKKSPVHDRGVPKIVFFLLYKLD